MKKDDSINSVIIVAVSILLIATLGVAGFNLIGNSTMITNYSEPIKNLTAPSTIYLSNSDLKSGTLSIYNATFGAAITTDYTIDISSGIITVPGTTRLLNGTAYTTTYQKDSVPGVVKILIITVISVVGAVCFVIIMITRLKRR